MSLQKIFWCALTLPLLAACDLSFSDIFSPGTQAAPLPLPKPHSETVILPENDVRAVPVTVPAREEEPANEVVSGKSVLDAVRCVENALESRMKLPQNFFMTNFYADGTATVALTNPYTGNQGLYLDVHSTDSGSVIRLYANYSTMSAAWRKLPEKCR